MVSPPPIIYAMFGLRFLLFVFIAYGALTVDSWLLRLALIAVTLWMILVPAIIDLRTLRSSLRLEGSSVVVTNNGRDTVIDADEVVAMAFVKEDLPTSQMLLASRGTRHVAFLNLRNGASVRADVTASSDGVRSMIGSFERPRIIELLNDWCGAAHVTLIVD